MRSAASAVSEAVKKSTREHILKLPERQASASERDARRTLKDLQRQGLWQVQRISRSFAVLRRVSLAMLTQRLRQSQDESCTRDARRVSWRIDCPDHGSVYSNVHEI